MLDFAALPPEINSARMYTGAGSGPLMAAASAWDSLALQLELAAVGYSEALAALHGPSWSGPAAAAMAAAATPYIAWLTQTAVQAEQAAMRARMAAAAYEAAFAATVPPVTVAANRSLLSSLIATNFFGQNLPAIAATEAAYAEMWAQDVVAMYGYAAASGPAASLESFEEPPPTTNPATGLAQSAAASPAPTAPTSTPAPNPWLDAYTDVIALHQYFNTYTRFTQIPIQLELTSGTWGSLIFKLAEAAVPKKISAVLPAAGLGAASSGAHAAVHARAATAMPLGKLSVPQSWTAAVPTDSPALRLTSASMPTGPAAGANPHMMVPPVGSGAQQRAKGTPVMRTLDRRFRMPRPAWAG